ncbi:Leucine-rich repeat receptor protein kinase [Quillaja saponaria]|uniref:Leucine-rich repeat receptor protein kinase n=1 Tax=Quillaja saponaria TaxID=32244 RepID=A0AAD7L3P1_QUISA|nr:Leucine-rich repeat receptor protein kinase [Quillaja saponaria]
MYHVLSLGTFERVAPEWMREDIMFSTTMCSIFFEGVRNQPQLATCSVGFSGKMTNNIRRDLIHYKVLDPSDNPLDHRKPGTLRYGASMTKEKVRFAFKKDMQIKLKKPLLISSFTAINGRGTNIVHIASNACLMIFKVIIMLFIFPLINLSEANLCVLKELPSLKSLSLRDCGIQDVSLISSLSCVNNTSSSLLERLDLSGNGFSSLIYKWLFNIGKSLVYLDLSGNQLQGAIPKSMGNLCAMRRIFLDGNKISGKFDDLFENLSGCMQNFLEHLSLSFNQFSGTFSDNISEFSSLNILDLSENLLVGSLPNIASFFPSLTKLNLDGNHFTGIPGNSFSGLFHLDTLSIADNSFKGILTENHLSDLFGLKELYLSRNSQLSLKINSDSVPPFQLNLLQLQSVKFGPKFPNWIKLQRNLTFLDMSNAEIFDSIPIWVWNTFPRLTFFNLSNNRIRGKLPPNLSIISFESIEIDLSFNNLEGPLPLFPFNLTYLDLSKNRLSGPLSILSKITPSISLIDLSDNMLSGNIPQIQCQSLCMLNLANNKLSGKIPNWLMQNWEFNSLILANNSLSGEIPSPVGNIPSQFTNFSALVALNLSQNCLNGTIPPKIGKLKELMSLDLSRNYLSGDIPSSMADLTFLNHLDLSYNNFSGKIPSSTQLQSFNASKFIGNPLLCGFHCNKSVQETKALTRVSQLTTVVQAQYKKMKMNLRNGFILVWELDLQSASGPFAVL